VLSLAFTQKVSRYTVYHRASSTIAALQRLLRTAAISGKSRLAMVDEARR